ncbi:HNH endonuclease [Acinetobacter baumannii]|uniref:HNH endonuclease n=1 Tax=Acinetobacter baumannii TaxID=470 RepID=UPI00230587BB|nr:HNH endonuclease signature motif containing protein [Acinetobacter baumannii]MDB0077501.1 hypothetical protein [Acinetobacter baumannii]
MNKASDLQKINKHGLSRTISPDIKRTIRQQDGYGCVICGNMLVDYEHIDPLFCDATEHNPANMALLCSHHHDQVTRRILPKRIIKEHKSNPYCKQQGFASSHYFPHPKDIKIKCGTSYFENTKKIIEINGKPIIWIEEEDNEILFNAIFYDNEGNKVGYLNKNTFIALVKDCDIYAIASRIEARLKKGMINLQLDIEADGIVDLKRLSANYGGTKININNKGAIHIESHGSSITLNDCKTFNCGGGISLGGIPQGQGIFFKLNALEKEIIKNKAKRIIHISGNIKGYIYKNQIINLNDLTSGYIKENSVYNLLDEYIGKLITSNIKNSYTIEIENDEYEDREPIYIEEKNKIINKLLNNPVIDTSYRILG